MFQSFLLIAIGIAVCWYGFKLLRVDRRFHKNAVRTEATVVAPRVKVPGGTTDQMMHVEFTDAEGRTVYAATVCDPPKPAEGDRIEVLYDPSRPGSGALPATRAGRSRSRRSPCRSPRGSWRRFWTSPSPPRTAPGSPRSSRTATGLHRPRAR